MTIASLHLMYTSFQTTHVDWTIIMTTMS